MCLEIEMTSHLLSFSFLHPTLFEAQGYINFKWMYATSIRNSVRRLNVFNNCWFKLTCPSVRLSCFLNSTYKWQLTRYFAETRYSNVFWLKGGRYWKLRGSENFFDQFPCYALSWKVVGCLAASRNQLWCLIVTCFFSVKIQVQVFCFKVKYNDFTLI